MPDQAKPSQRVPLDRLREQVRGELLPAAPNFTYFRAGQPLAEEDVRDYLEEPIAALPPAVASHLPPVALLFVPFLEKNGHDAVVTYDAPPEDKSVLASLYRDKTGAVLTYAIDDMEVAGYHYEFYRHVAELLFDAAGKAPRMDEYPELLKEELKSRMHGEVDDAAWQRKQELLQRSSAAAVKKDSKLFRDYAKQSFIDTMTLYLHGICCDIDVEPGPRQLPSPKLRRRLKLLREIFPPPKGYAVFPEELDQIEAEEARGQRPS